MRLLILICAALFGLAAEAQDVLGDLRDQGLALPR